jgi:RNA polymerase sigma factor (sigma-70 family)
VTRRDFLSGLSGGEVHTYDMGAIDSAGLAGAPANPAPAGLQRAIEKTDVELVEASRRGELDAFGHLVARYQDVVCAVGYSATGDRVLGEDVAQETFIAAWRQLDRVRDVMRLRSWLCGIARNLGRKARKRTQREQLVDPDDQVAATPSAFEELARNDAERIVRGALARVPESYREALVLYYREDLSIRAVAETLGISEDAAMQRLSRGRRYLADSVSSLVERSLKDTRPRRDLVAAVVAAIAATFAIPSHVDASPVSKGSTMLKLAIAASTLAVVGTTAFLLRGHDDAPAAPPVQTQAKALLHYGAQPPRVPTLGPTATPHVTAARQAAATDLGLLPADADVVFGIDMARIKGSALWQMFVAPQLGNATGLHEFAAKCGFDPLASLSSVSIGVRGVATHGRAAGTIVIHGFDKAKAWACLRTQQWDGPNAYTSVTVDGDVLLLTHTHGSAGITFINDSTALVVFSTGTITKATMDSVTTGDSGLEASPAFADLFHNINSDDPLWFVIGPSSSLFTKVNAAIATKLPDLQVNALYGSIDITDAISVQAGMRLATADQVNGLVAKIQPEIDKLVANHTLSEYFDQLDVNADGGDVIVSLAVNASQLINMATSKSSDASAGATPPNPDGSGTFSITLGD